MEEYLKLTGCPYRLSASKIDNLDCEKILPVVEWLVQHVEAMQEDRRGKYSCMEQTIKEEESTLLQLEFELKNRENSVKMLNANMDEQNQKKANLISELQYLRERISKEGAYEEVQRLVSHMEILKDMENKVLNFQANNSARHCELQTEIVELEEKIASMNDGKSLVDDLDNSLKKSLEKLNLAKKNRAARLREIVSVQRKLDDFPSQSELIQYEHRFSELYVHIQRKLRQTRNYYGTYNALLEIKELMLKETSLLNSISSQFQDAISSAAGRLKLTDSMEEIVKGSQQKLEKVQLALQEEQKVCDTLKERYIVAVAEQSRSTSLVLALKEECPKNERLRGHSTV